MARGHHDIGGMPGAGPIDQSQHELADWEVLADAINQALGAKGIRRTDELRRVREEMESDAYRGMRYYERWIASMETILVEKKILTRDEIGRKLAEFASALLERGSNPPTKRA
jgi:nitrile hydratase